jgi:hypothetical protein
MTLPYPIKALIIAALVVAAAAVLWTQSGGSGAINVPSGQQIVLQEVIFEPQNGGETWLRARFVAPEIGSKFGFDAVADDFTYLCASFVLPLLRNESRTATQVVISMADREIAFGDTDPDATQFFEAFRIENDICIWESF